MPLLDHDEGDAGPVVLLKLHAGLSDGQQFMLEHRLKLALAHPVAIHHDPVRLEAGLPVEVDQRVPDHGGHGADHVTPRLLDPHHCAVGRGVRVY